MSPDLQHRFDALLEDCIKALPPRLQELIDKVPVIVLDVPTPQMIQELLADGVLQPGDDPAEICGLHTGVGITDRSIDDPEGWGGMGGIGDQAAPEQVHLFREGIVELAGGWIQPNADDNVYEEIRITLLHELGHHFGLDETDLDGLGYA